MFLANRMTVNPITVKPSTSVIDAAEIMRVNKIRRLPVLENNKLVGIVTDRDLREVAPSPATSLSIFELNYLLAKMQIREVMQKNVITINQHATIEEAALLMYNHKIGGLVVVDDNNCVVGIITETDIFKLFVDVMGLPQGKTRITIHVNDDIGVLHNITGIFNELKINIGSVVTLKLPNGEFEIVIRADVNTDNIEELVNILKVRGYNVVHVAQIR